MNTYALYDGNRNCHFQLDQICTFRLQGISDTGIALTLLLAFCFVPAGYILYLVTERVTQQRRLQTISGVGTLMYWGTTYVWDFVRLLNCIRSLINFLIIHRQWKMCVCRLCVYVCVYSRH